MIVAALVIATAEDFRLNALYRSYASLQTHWIAGRKWEIEKIPDLVAGDNHVIEVRRDGKLKLKIDCDELRGTLIGAARAWYPVGYPVITVSGHTGCSHGQTTRFYAISRGELHQMFEIEGEVGGPIFRDLDGDGKNEWIFDNYDFWQANPPTQYLVYRQSGFRVSFWKKLPNPKRVELPSPGVRYH